MKTHESVWDALGSKERNKLVARSDLLIHISNALQKNSKNDYPSIAKKLGISKGELELLSSNKHNAEYTIDDLCDILNHLGVKVTLTFDTHQIISNSSYLSLSTESLRTYQTKYC